MTDKEIEKVKRRANILFANGEELEAFALLYTIGPKLFYQYCSKKGHIEKPLFWNEFILNEAHLEALIACGIMEQVLYEYFLKVNVHAQLFLEKVADIAPKSLFKSVRRTAIFLDPNQLEVLKKLKLPKTISLDQQAWNIIYLKEQRLWKKVQKHKKSLRHIPIRKILAGLAFWIEDERYSMADENEEATLAYVYNFFVSFYFSEFEDDLAGFNFGDFEKYFALILIGKEQNRISKLLIDIQNWLLFKMDIIDPFCYDDDFLLAEQDGKFIFQYAAGQPGEEWQKNGSRYGLNVSIYSGMAKQMAEVLEEDGKLVIPGEDLETEDHNRYFTIKRLATIGLLEDLAVRKFKLGDQGIEANDMLFLIQGFSQNLFKRYEFNLEKHKRTSKNFLDAYNKLLNEHYAEGRLVEAYIFETFEEYFARNKGAIENLTESANKNLLSLFSIPTYKFEEFNRFEIQYDVWHKPYLNIAGHIFCPTFFLARNDWFYSFAQIMLLNNRGTSAEKKGTDDMEEHLTNKLKDKGWNADWVGKNDSSASPGDIDVIVFNESTVILMQLKRSRFRTTLKSAYNEQSTSIKKAAEQINMAAENILQEYQFDKKEMRIEKWIVSTSFENVLVEVEGCLKVNYFDALLSLINKDIKTLDEYVEYIKTDQNYILTARFHLNHTFFGAQ